MRRGSRGPDFAGEDGAGGHGGGGRQHGDGLSVGDPVGPDNVSPDGFQVGINDGTAAAEGVGGPTIGKVTAPTIRLALKRLNARKGENGDSGLRER